MAFTYKIVANPTGSRPYRAAIDNQPTIEGAAFLAELATASGQNPATVEAVLRAAFTVIGQHAANAEPIGDVLGLFRVFPSCGGSYLVPDPAGSDVAKTVTFNIAPTAEFIGLIQAAISMQKTGESGVLAPEIASVSVMPGGAPDSFSPGKGLEIRGQHLRGRNAAIPTVQLINNTDAGDIVPLLVLDASDARLVCSVPTGGFDGSCWLKVIAPYGGDTRQGEYSQLLTMVT